MNAAPTTPDLANDAQRGSHWQQRIVGHPSHFQRLPSLKNKCENRSKTVDTLTITAYRVQVMKNLNIIETYPALAGVSEKQINYGGDCRRSWLRSASDLAAEINRASADEAAIAMPMLQSIVDAAMADTSAKAWIERESALGLMQAAIAARGLA